MKQRLPVRFTGFSLKWYQELFQDRDMLQALKQPDSCGIQLCGISSDRNIGGCRNFQDSLENKRNAGIYFHPPLMIPEIILGMVLMAFFYTCCTCHLEC